MVTNRFYPPRTSRPMTGENPFRPMPGGPATPRMPGFNPPRISPPMTGNWQDNWKRDRGFNPPRISPPMTGGGPFRPMPGGPTMPGFPSRPGPGRGFLPGEPPPGTTPGRGRYPGSPPKRGRRGGPGPEWGGGQPIVIDPRTGRPTWKWSPGGSYATKVAGVYTDPEHMRRVSELARYKPIQREAPPVAEPLPGEVPTPAPEPTTPTQAYDNYQNMKWWDQFGGVARSILGDYNTFMSKGGLKGLNNQQIQWILTRHPDFQNQQMSWGYGQKLDPWGRGAYSREGGEGAAGDMGSGVSMGGESYGGYGSVAEGMEADYGGYDYGGGSGDQE